MSRSGFRTLCIAQRDIQPEAYEVCRPRMPIAMLHKVERWHAEKV